MQGHKQFVNKVVLRFRLSERVPMYNLYRRLAELLDWDFLYPQTQALYSHTGQPSLDPVVFFKLMLVSRLQNLVSDRHLVEHGALRLDILHFLGYEVDEDLPWHSTISRTRQLYPASVFKQLFDHVFAQCVAQGLVAGDTQVVDSAPVKANASLRAVREKQPAGTSGPFRAPDEPAVAAPDASVVSAPAHQLRQLATTQAHRRHTPLGHVSAQHKKARLLSNKTHYCPTDPEARIFVKTGKARALDYLCSLAVGTAHGVISHVPANFVDSRDSLHLPRLRSNELPLRELLADAGYANGPNYALLEAQHITAWIPVFGQYKSDVDSFPYDEQTDTYQCPAGKRLLFKKVDTTADGSWVKLYRSTYQECRQCPLKPTCIPKGTYKQLTRTIYGGPYRRAWQRQQSQRGQRMHQLRQSTVEPVFGSLIQHYGLCRTNVRGHAGVHKTMLLAAVAYNLKKLLKHRPTQQVSAAVALQRPLLTANSRFQAPTRALEKQLFSK